MPKFITNIANMDWSDVPPMEHKYVSYDDAMAKFPIQAVAILDIMSKHLTYKYKYIVVDLKVRELTKGQHGCPLPDWHYDCVKDYNHPQKHENHLLYTNIHGTEIAIDDALNFIKANNGDIYQYGRELHRTAKMPENCKRVLIRLTECDNVRPKSIRGII
jgi:hypothetical protein